MRLLDSNIIISAAQAGAEGLRALISEGPPAVSAASYVEVFGYHRLTDEDRRDFAAFFAAVPVLSISSEVIRHAVELRQSRKMSLGDALIAGTALTHGLPLITRDTKDFQWITGLTVIDPFSSP